MWIGREIALVTGGSSGLGRSICLELATRVGCVFELSRRSRHEPESTSNIVHLAADLNLPKEVSRALGRIPADTTIDLLVLNAGVLDDPYATIDGLEIQFATNFMSQLRLLMGLVGDKMAKSAKVVLIGSAGANPNQLDPALHFHSLDEHRLRTYERSKWALMQIPFMHFPVTIQEIVQSLSFCIVVPPLMQTQMVETNLKDGVLPKLGLALLRILGQLIDAQEVARELVAILPETYYSQPTCLRWDPRLRAFRAELAEAVPSEAACLAKLSAHAQSLIQL